MKNLFLVDGASGTGKTDLINYISNFQTSITYVQKYTTREKREYEKRRPKEKLDLIHINKNDFDSKTFEYKYNYAGEMYGFAKKQIDNAFLNNDNVFIIIRNVDVMIKLKEDYGYLNVVSLYVYTDKNLIVQRLKKDTYSQKEINFRMNRLRIAHESYLKNPDLYDTVLVNSGSKADYNKIIEKIYKKYQKNRKWIKI